MRKISSLVVIALALAFCFGQSAFAQNKPLKKDCWIDEATGKALPRAPLGSSPRDYHHLDDHWTDPRTGKSYIRQSDGSWINEGTGEPLPGAPLGSSPQDYHHLDDHWTDPRTGKSYIRVPCPPPNAGQNAGHTIKKILESVSIGVGVGGGELGGDDRRDKFHHDDRHVTDSKHSTDRLATDHKTQTTDQHTSKLSDAQKNATTSSDKNRAHDHKKPTPTPTPHR